MGSYYAVRAFDVDDNRPARVGFLVNVAGLAFDVKVTGRTKFFGGFAFAGKPFCGNAESAFRALDVTDGFPAVRFLFIDLIVGRVEIHVTDFSVSVGGGCGSGQPSCAGCARCARCALKVSDRGPSARVLLVDVAGRHIQIQIAVGSVVKVGFARAGQPSCAVCACRAGRSGFTRRSGLAGRSGFALRSLRSRGSACFRFGNRAVDDPVSVTVDFNRRGSSVLPFD